MTAALDLAARGLGDTVADRAIDPLARARPAPARRRRSTRRCTTRSPSSPPQRAPLARHARVHASRREARRALQQRLDADAGRPDARGSAARRGVLAAQAPQQPVDAAARGDGRRGRAGRTSARVGRRRGGRPRPPRARPRRARAGCRLPSPWYQSGIVGLLVLVQVAWRSRPGRRSSRRHARARELVPQRLGERPLGRLVAP